MYTVSLYYCYVNVHDLLLRSMIWCVGDCRLLHGVFDYTAACRGNNFQVLEGRIDAFSTDISWWWGPEDMSMYPH